ncbi:MAG: hypothetical protein RL662_513 [Bacteroidota bacterium]|jgi:hypothetical protein
MKKSLYSFLAQHAELLITMLLACYYIYLAINLQTEGWYTPESLFFSEKASLLFSGENNTLKISLFTYPLIGFLVSLPFSLLDTLSGPVIASSLGMAGICFYLLRAFRQQNMGYFLQVATLMLFVLHPSIVYAAISGSGDYITIFVLIIFYVTLFHYLSKGSTFHLAISSILLSVILLVDYKLLWVGIFVFPILVVASVNRMNLQEQTFLSKIRQICRDKTLFNEFSLSIFSRVFLFYVLPIIMVMAHIILNQLYTDSPYYFIESLYANVDAHEILKGSNTLFGSPNVIYASLWVVIGYFSLTIAPLFVLTIYLIRRNSSQLFILFSFILLLALQVLIYPFIPKGVLFVAFIFILMLSINESNWHKHQSSFTKYTLLIAVIVGIVGSYYTIDKQRIWAEKVITDIVLTNSIPEVYKEEKRIVDFIQKNVKDDARILSDDANTFQIVALYNNPKRFILPYHQQYKQIKQNPVSRIQYILVSRPDKFFMLTSELSLQFYNTMAKDKTDYYPIFESEKWVIYEVRQ